MPALNPERRELIVDTAVTVLAEDGAGRLTHRRVDAAAGLPPGTTTNYHPTRVGLFSAAAQRVAELHWEYVAQLEEKAPAIGRDGLAALLGRLVTMPDEATQKRSLAMFELFFEGTRSPALRPILDDIYTAAMKAAETILQAGGMNTDPDRVRMFACLLRGLAIDRLTVPGRDAIDIHQSMRLIAQLLDNVFGLDE